MTADDFRQWLDDMQAANLARFDADAAALLGVHKNSILTMKRNGADQRTALACAALLHGIPAYSRTSISEISGTDPNPSPREAEK